jgi:lipoate---protein ligase
MWIDDQILKNHAVPFYCEIFVPGSTVVVLGSGNDQALEVNSEACAAADISVLRRYGGGGTVVLYPGCVVVSVGCWVKDVYQNSFYFDVLNQAVITALAAKQPKFAQLHQAGISDIVCNGKKVAGTSMFRSRNYLLYQASLLVDLDSALVASLLKHPTKEPDYRKGRSHSDFLTSLNAVAGDGGTAEGVAEGLLQEFSLAAKRHLGDHLVEPVHEQFPALAARLLRSAIPVD